VGNEFNFQEWDYLILQIAGFKWDYLILQMHKPWGPTAPGPPVRSGGQPPTCAVG
jgi:hypothetical protein